MAEAGAIEIGEGGGGKKHGIAEGGEEGGGEDRLRAAVGYGAQVYNIGIFFEVHLTATSKRGVHLTATCLTECHLTEVHLS